MSLILGWGIIFTISLIVLIKASGYFTKSAEKLGNFFGIQPFVIGVVVVAIGTSLPELASSILAVLENSPEIVTGNVIGSNIANIFLILGIVAVVGKKFRVKYELLHVDLPMLVGSAFLLSLMLWDNIFTKFEAVLSIFGMLIYFLHATHIKRRQFKELGTNSINNKKTAQLDLHVPLTFILSLIALFFGAKFTVESVVALSDVLHIGKAILAIVPVALGTSLPELAVSLTAIRQNKPEIAVGNILGSNVFNAFGVMGISGLIKTLIIPHNIVAAGVPMMIIATLLYFFITQDREVTQWEGWLLILFYGFFLGQIVFFL